MKHKQIKKEVLLWFGGILFAILLFFSLLFYYFFDQAVSQSLLTGLHTKAIHIRDNVIPHLHEHRIDYSATDYEYAVVAQDKVIYRSANFEMQHLKKLEHGERLLFEEGEEYQNAIYMMEIEEPIEAYIIVVAHQINDELEDFVDLLLIIAPLLFLLLLWILWHVIEHVLSPIAALSQEVEHIDVNQLKPLPSRVKDYEETVVLRDAFNRMIKRIQEGVSQLNRFNSDVSHELRTPLTVIRGEIETVLRHPRDEDYYRQSMETILYETTQIEAIVENLLIVTKYDPISFLKHCEEVDISVLLIGVIERADEKLQKASIRLDIDTLEPLSVHCSRQLMGTVFSNLIDNAIKYSPSKSTITLSLFQKNNHHYFVLRDEGIGIPAEALDQITERFYRVDQSRTRKIKGFGLGLSIVKNILDLHQFKLMISSQPNQGTTVTIIF